MASKEYKTLKKYVEAPKDMKSKDKVKKYSKSVYKKLESIRNVFEDVLNPDIGDLAISHEIRGIIVDSALIWAEYKKLMKAMRLYELAELLDDTQKYENFLEYADSIIEELIKEAEKIIKTKMLFWDKNIEYKKPKEYLG